MELEKLRKLASGLFIASCHQEGFPSASRWWEKHFEPGPSQHWLLELQIGIFHCLEEIGSHIVCWQLKWWPVGGLANGQTPQVVALISPLWAIAPSLKWPPCPSNTGQKHHHWKIGVPPSTAAAGQYFTKESLSKSAQQLQIFESIPVSWMIACNQPHCCDVKGRFGVCN